MINRLAKRIALKHIEQNYSQPLRLQPDYGERNAADFLGETGVSVNTGYYGKLKVGPGSQSGVVADDFDANEIESIEIIDDMGLDRMAKDHEDSGSYMSRANLKEINDMADFIIDDIGMDELDDWVEDKISHAHSAMSDVARYRGYRDDHPHGEESFKFAGRKMTPFEIVTNWFAQAEEESEGEIEYMMGVDGDDEMSGDVEILSGHDISSLIRDLKRDLRWSNIEFSKSGSRTISWSLPTQSGGFEGEHFRFANDEIIDDMGIMADFDKYSRYSKGEKGSKEYEKAKAEGNVPDEFLEYEGSVLSPGDSPDPKIVEQNKEEMDKSAYYEIIDDLEW